jgi:hypothetical protein
MGDFNMYHPIKFRIEYNSFGKIVNNLIYMYARDMILHSFERFYSIIKIHINSITQIIGIIHSSTH